jgi:hypothetical protein
MGDIDLLVHRKSLAQALEALASLGYTASDPGLAGSAFAVENEVELVLAGGFPSQLEVHWSLFDSPYYQRVLALDWFWETTSRVKLGGVESLVLGSEAQLLHLCGHLMLHHDARGLLWYHDIAEWIASFRDGIDWQSLLRRAQQFDLLLPLQRILPRVAADWLAPIPGDALSSLSDLRPSRQERRVDRWLSRGRSTVAGHLWSDLRSLSSGSERVGYALDSLFPRPEYMMERYHIRSRLWVPLYYPYRWLIGLKRRRRRGSTDGRERPR